MSGPGLRGGDGALSHERWGPLLRPLFVGGCQRSGTTAFVDYLNVHPEILVCHERYKRVPRERLDPSYFTFERILDYREGETNKPWNLARYVRRHAEILENKDPSRLRWIGDKNPVFVLALEHLARNNPGARFVFLYRPVEEVAESWNARATDPGDHWSGEEGFEAAVEAWNRALRRIRAFVEGSRDPRALLVGYREFFGGDERYPAAISRFLGVEVDSSVAAEWRRRSESFRAGRREKEPLSDEQLAHIERRADRESEAWVLDRIERQWEDPSLYVETDFASALDARDRAEARAWRSEQRLKLREEELARQRAGNDELRRRAEVSEKHLAAVRGSRTFRLLDGMNRAGHRALNRLRGRLQSRLRKTPDGKGS